MYRGNIIPPIGTPINKSAPIAMGLTHFWPLNEGDGNIALDLIGGGLNNGVLTNGTTWAASPFGKVASFDGTDDYIETNYVLPAADFSFGAWAFSTSTSRIGNRIMGNGDSLGGLDGADIIWEASATNSIYAVRRKGVNNGATDMTSGVLANFTGFWHHIMQTYNSTVGSVLYYDGKNVKTNTTTGFTSSLPVRIGRDGNGTDRFNGKICLAGIWSRALLQIEVQQLYTRPYSMFKSANRLKFGE